MDTLLVMKTFTNGRIGKAAVSRLAVALNSGDVSAVWAAAEAIANRFDWLVGVRKGTWEIEVRFVTKTGVKIYVPRFRSCSVDLGPHPAYEVRMGAGGS